MKYLVYAALAFFGMLIFLPKDGTMRPDNLPLLLFLLGCFILYHIFRFSKHLILLCRMRKLLIGKGAKIVHFYPLGIMGSPDLSAEINGITLHIILLMHKSSRTQYHFESANRLEYFKSNRIVYRAGGASGAKISNEVVTKRIGGRTFPWNNLSDPAVIPVLVIDRQPQLVTDSERHEPVGNGDTICKKVYWYNYTGFTTHLDKFLSMLQNSASST